MSKWWIMIFVLIPTVALAKTVQICNYSTSPSVYIAYSAAGDFVQGERIIPPGYCTQVTHEGDHFYYSLNHGNLDWLEAFKSCVLSPFKLADPSFCRYGRNLLELKAIRDYYKLNLKD
jgi:hypothetical protein